MTTNENALMQGGFNYLQEKKELPIKWEGKDEKVVIKKMSNGELSWCRKQANDQRVIGKEMVVKTDSELFKDLVIIKGTFSAPFKLDITDVQKLSPVFATALADEIMKFNNLGDEKKAD